MKYVKGTRLPHWVWLHRKLVIILTKNDILISLTLTYYDKHCIFSYMCWIKSIRNTFIPNCKDFEVNFFSLMKSWNLHDPLSQKKTGRITFLNNWWIGIDMNYSFFPICFFLSSAMAHSWHNLGFKIANSLCLLQRLQISFNIYRLFGLAIIIGISTNIKQIMIFRYESHTSFLNLG